jgi:hypothetical protein
MKKTKTVQLTNKEVEVSKLPFKKYADLLKRIKQLPKHLSDFEGKSNDQIFQMLPNLIAECYDDIAGMLEVATGLTKEEIDELDLVELTDLVIGVYEVNRYAEVYEKIKKATTQTTKTVKPN